MIREIDKMLGDLQIENNKLKQTLTEIKEIIQDEFIVCDYWGDCTSCEYDCGVKTILQKISEV